MSDLLIRAVHRPLNLRIIVALMATSSARLQRSATRRAPPLPRWVAAMRRTVSWHPSHRARRAGHHPA